MKGRKGEEFVKKGVYSGSTTIAEGSSRPSHLAHTK